MIKVTIHDVKTFNMLADVTKDSHSMKYHDFNRMVIIEPNGDAWQTNGKILLYAPKFVTVEGITSRFGLYVEKSVTMSKSTRYVTVLEFNAHEDVSNGVLLWLDMRYIPEVNKIIHGSVPCANVTYANTVGATFLLEEAPSLAKHLAKQFSPPHWISSGRHAHLVHDLDGVLITAMNPLQQEFRKGRNTLNRFLELVENTPIPESTRYLNCIGINERGMDNQLYTKAHFAFYRRVVAAGIQGVPCEPEAQELYESDMILYASDNRCIAFDESLFTEDMLRAIRRLQDETFQSKSVVKDDPEMSTYESLLELGIIQEHRVSYEDSPHQTYRWFSLFLNFPRSIVVR